jgi:NitT/TauT family transport system permease protein
MLSKSAANTEPNIQFQELKAGLNVPSKGYARRRLLGDVSSPVMLVMQIVVGIAILLIWQFSSGRLIDEFMISNPLKVISRLQEWITSGTVWVHIGATMHATIVGFLIGAIAGALGGLWLGLSPFMSRLLAPYLWALNASPKVALAPLFILWFGLGIESKIALSAILVVFLVFINTFAGVREVDADLVDSLRLMGAKRNQILTKVIVPSAASWIFVGIQTAIPYALIGTIIGEMIASNRGLGYLVQRAGSEFDTAGVFAALIVISVIGVILNQIFTFIQARSERWKIVSR